MKSISIQDLRSIIFEHIDETIDDHRKSKRNKFYYDPYPTATEDELDDFIKSIPYFTDDLKKFLLGKNHSSTLFVPYSWLERFDMAIWFWYDSEEWLDYGPEYISNPSLNEKEGVEKLDMPLMY